MQSRPRSLDGPPVLFADQGAAAHERPGTVAAVVLARRLGATGLWVDVWLTADDVAVVHPTGSLGGLRRSLRSRRRDQLPAEVPTVDEVVDAWGPDLPIVWRARDPEVVGVMPPAQRQWWAHERLDVVKGWRKADGERRLASVARLRALEEGPERRAAALRDLDVDAIALDRSDWSAGMVTLFHRFGRRAWATGATHRRMIREVLAMGVDGVCSDHVDRLIDGSEAAEA